MRHYQVRNETTGLWKKVELETGIVVATSRHPFQGTGVMKTEEQRQAVEAARKPRQSTKPTDPLADYR